MTSNITTYLKYANLQMAAESLFGVTPTDPVKSHSCCEFASGMRF